MEKAFTSETYARSVRREMIEQGRDVSLLAYDPDRGVYVFDVTEPEPRRTAVRYEPTTRTTLTDYGDRIYVRVTLLPGIRRWECPSAATMRKWVDEFLKDGDTARKRDGAGVPLTVTPGWAFNYYTKEA